MILLKFFMQKSVLTAAQQNVQTLCLAGIGDLTHALVEGASERHTLPRHFRSLMMKNFMRAIHWDISQKMGTNVLAKASDGMNFPQIVHALEEL